ncbi:hypothetical protein ACSBR1_040702 [Camellia fascicularis]
MQGRKRELRIESLAALEKMISNLLSILGLMPTSYSEIFKASLVLKFFCYIMIVSTVLEQLREKALKRAKLTEDQVVQKIEERTTARMNKEYAKSDAIRKGLAEVGIALMDSPEGTTTWRPTIPLHLQEQQVAVA